MARQTILNASMKEQIVLKALDKAGIKARKVALRAARVDWAERVRLKALGGAEAEAEILKTLKKIDALVAKLPEVIQSGDSVVNQRLRIYLNLAGCRCYAYFNGNHSRYEAVDDVIKLAPNEYTLLADDPLVTEFHGFDALYKQIKSDEEDIRQNVHAALDKVRTVKRLLEEWPEAKELLPPETPKAALPPAIHRETLNSIIGLPTGEEATA